jgi:DNA invertase Pin-like site-specific DNA recombinase
MKIKAVLFCRVSSREQETDGYSLPAQEKLLKEHASSLDISTTQLKIFSISESASGHKQRQIFNEMLSYVAEHNITIIICEKVDRLTRNLKDAVDVNDWLNADSNRQVHFVKEGVVLSRDSKSNEKFIWNIKVSVAQYYIDNLSEEVKKGQKEKIEEGWLPTRPPVGYKTIGEKGHKIHVVDEEKSPLVIKMFEYYDSGSCSLRLLTKKMYKEGLRNDHGNIIVMSRIHQLLQNPFYIGKIRWNGIITQGEHEPIIDKDVFERVQRRLRGKGTPRYSKHFYLFNHLLHCKECKGVITWEMHKDIVYGHCNHHNECKQNVWAKEYQIEEQIASVFNSLEVKNERLQRWIQKALKEGLEDETHYFSAALTELNKQHEHIKNRLNRLYDDKVDGKITQEFYDEKYKEYTEERDTVIDAIGKHANADNKYIDMGVSLYNLSQNASETYLKEKLIEEKRKLINKVFKNIILDNGVLNYELTPQAASIQKLSELANNSQTIRKVEPLLMKFEQQENVDMATQIEALRAVSPELLRG